MILTITNTLDTTKIYIADPVYMIPNFDQIVTDTTSSKLKVKLDIAPKTADVADLTLLIAAGTFIAKVDITRNNDTILTYDIVG